MKLEERVQLYKKELKNIPTTRWSFNPWAFVFGAFFYLFKGMPWLFSAFILAETVLIVAFSFAFPYTLVVVALLTHFVAAIVAKGALIRYKQRFIKWNENVHPDEPVHYCEMPVMKMVVFYLITGGFYDMYWGWQNWKKYQQATNTCITPWLRGWFFWLTVPFLFAKISRTVQSKAIVWYGIALFLLNILYAIFVGVMPVSAITFLVTFVWLVLSVLCFIPVQKAINAHVLKVYKKKPVDTTPYWETAFVAVTTAWFALLLFFGYAMTVTPVQPRAITDAKFPAGFSSKEVVEIVDTTGIIVRHLFGYDAFCELQGYSLQQYPDTANKALEPTINALEATLARKGYKLSDAFDFFMENGLQDKVTEVVTNDMEAARKRLIMSAAAAKDGVAESQVVWDEEWRSMMPMKTMCEILDEEGFAFFRN